MALRRATSPAREVLNQLTNRESNRIRPSTSSTSGTCTTTSSGVTDEVDNDRELVAGTLDVYLSTVNNNLSAIMKRLTGVTVILAGMGAVAGIFGMSEAGTTFDGAEHAGFWMVTALIVALAAAIAASLRRIDPTTDPGGPSPAVDRPGLRVGVAVRAGPVDSGLATTISFG